MQPLPIFSLKDLLRSIVLGVLVGWLLVSINDPAHKRFDFTLTDSCSDFGNSTG